MIPDEITPLWNPDGSVATFVARDSRILPRGRVVRDVHHEGQGERDPQAPVKTMLAFRIVPEVASQYGVGPTAAAQAQELPLDERHITLAYIGEADGLERQRLHDFTRRWLAESDWPPVEGRAQGWGTFTPPEDGKPVLWMSWDIPGLAEMRTQLVNDLKAEGFDVSEDHDFTPHETIAYMTAPIAELPPFPESQPTQVFNSLVVGEDDFWTEYTFPMAMALRDGATMSLTAALESATTGLEAYSDEELDALIAAGGADRNRGNAEKLRRYWTIGKGGAKIRWNSPGDFDRCVKYLSKHLGPRAKGWCALRHKEMTRMWTGDMKHRIMYGWGGRPGSYWAKVAARSAANANNTVLVATADHSGEAMPDANPILMMLNGQKPAPVTFRIPLLLPEGIESGDGRTFKEGVVELRDLPIPLLWQPNSMQGHDGAAIVGRIDSVERVEGGMGNATGVFDTSPLAMEAVRMIREGFLRGVSADLDRFEAKIKGKGPGTTEAEKKEDDEETVTPDKMDITKGRIMAATLVAKPAFQECRIELDEPAPLPDGEYTQELGPDEQRMLEELATLLREEAQATFAITASGFKAAPIYPPKEWFDNPGLTKPTRLTITDDGRVFGHLAAWHVDHIGMGFGTRPPRSRSGYAYFMTGLVRTKEGEDVRVGQLTLTGGHASLSADAREAVKHYDDTASAWADVAAGEDSHGIWVAGSLRPAVTAEQVRAARASSISGDWRPIQGALELVAACSVNVPGFPLVEARVASGEVLALVAAGLAPLYADQLIALDPQAAALAARRRVFAPLDAKALEVSARMAKARVLSTQPVSVERRKAMAKKGWALPDGAYPIADVADLKRAIKSYGRAKESERAKVRKHIAKRARALGHPELIPEDWKNLSDWSEITLAMQAVDAAEFRDYSSEKREEMAKEGIAMKGGRYPIATVADLKAAIKAYGRGNPADKPEIRKHISKRARALGHPELIPDTWKDLSADVPFVEATEALVASLKTMRRREWDEQKISRDDVGRFRKIYYRLRNSPSSSAPEVRAALKAIKEAERVAEQEGMAEPETAKLAKEALDSAAESKIDERTQSEVIKAAQDMASLMERIEARGPEATIPFDQLPTEIQDAMKRYMKQSNLEERITKHFGPYMSGEVERSVADIVNFLERIIVDSQNYRRGYDTERV
jgi:2'-5' RNA ligase